MDEPLGWPFLIGLLVATLAAGTAVEHVGVRRRLAAAIPPAERWFLRMSLGLVFVTWWGVLLSELGWFGAGTLLAAPAAVFALWLGFRLAFRGPPGPAQNWFDARWIVVVVVFAAGLVLYFPPYDVRLEARDPGVYYHAGVKLAQVGALQWEDSTFNEMSSAEREYWMPLIGGRPHESNRYIGFYLQSRANPVVIPQALPVFPIFVAIGHRALGVAGGLAAAPVLAILGALGLFFFAARWLTPTAGAVAALMLATGFVQVWFARYAAAELAAQVLLCAALYGLVCYRRHGDAAFGWLAAVGIGLSFMTKAELLVLVVPLALLLIHDTARDGLVWRQWARFWLPLAALTAHTLLHARLRLWPYYFDLLRQVRLTPGQFVVIAGGAAAGLAALLLLLDKSHRKGDLFRIPRPLASAAAWSVALAVPLFFAWGVWIRPGDEWDSANFLHLVWAVSPWFVLLGVAGTVGLLLSPRGGRGRDAILAILLVVIGLGLYHRQIIPLLPWAYRRWVPVVLPGFLALGGGAAAWLLTGQPRGPFARPPWLRRAAPAIAGVLLVLGMSYQAGNTLYYRAHEEMQGVDAILDELEASFEPGSLLIFEPRTRRGLERFAAALALDRGFDVLRMPSPAVDEDVFRSVLLRAERRGRSVYLFTTGYIDGVTRFGAEPFRRLSFRTRRLHEPGIGEDWFEDLGVGLPREVRELNITGRIYRLRLDGSLPKLARRLDVGDWDDPYLLGSHFNEIEFEGDGTPARWTRGDAGFWLPGLDDGASKLIVRAAAITSSSRGEQSMTALLDGELLGTAVLVGGWNDYEFAIPEGWEPGADGLPYLEIQVQAYRPADVIPGSTDTRRIGIKVDKVGWLPVDPAAER